MKVSFFPRSNTLWARVTKSGEIARFTSKIKIPADAEFCTNKQEFLGKSTKVILANSKIAASKAAILQMASINSAGDVADLYRETFNPSPEPDQDLDDGKILLCPTMDLYVKGGKNKGGKDYAANSLSLFQCAGKMLESYGKAIDLMDFDLNRYPDQKTRKEIGIRWNKYWRGFDAFMAEEEELMANSRASYFRMINTVLRWIEDEEFITLPKLQRPSTEEPPIVVLDPDFVRDFVYKDYTQIDRYMWEACSMMLMTTLRISDAMALMPHHFTEIDGSLYLNKRNRKTGATTKTKIHPRLAEAVIENIKKYGRPYCEEASTFRTRSQMQEFFSQFEECQKEITVEYAGETSTLPLWQHCKPHMMRKSAITRMICSRVPLRDIKFLSGHTGDSKAFERYVAFVQSSYNESMDEYLNNT